MIYLSVVEAGTRMKAFLFDIDQTIQNREGDTPLEVWKILAEMSRRGVAVACVTARPFSMSTQILRKLKGDAYSILDGGACLVRNDGTGRAYEKFVNDSSVKGFVESFLPNPRLRVGISTQHGFYANSTYLAEIKGWFDHNRGFRELTSPIGNAYSIWVRDAAAEEVLAIKEAFPGDHKVSVEKQHDDNLSLFICNKRSSKVEGLDNFCRVSGISLGEIAFVGDDDNDSEVAGKVGISAAVKNACGEMKKSSHLQLSRPYGEGVLEFLGLLGY